MRACWLKWVGWDWSISADYIWLIFSDANNSLCLLMTKRCCDLTIEKAEGAYGIT